MVKVTLIDQDGKPVLPKDLEKASDLQHVVEQARTLIRNCENLALEMRQAKNPAQRQGGTPYLG